MLHTCNPAAIASAPGGRKQVPARSTNTAMPANNTTQHNIIQYASQYDTNKKYIDMHVLAGGMTEHKPFDFKATAHDAIQYHASNSQSVVQSDQVRSVVIISNQSIHQSLSPAAAGLERITYIRYRTPSDFSVTKYFSRCSWSKFRRLMFSGMLPRKSSEEKEVRVAVIIVLFSFLISDSMEEFLGNWTI
jgi:hypothetical protein